MSSPQLELNLGHFCNNRCVFCVSGQLTERGQAGNSDCEELIARLDDAATRGVRTVTLLGGEPTLHRQFTEVVDHAAKLPFDEIVIFTNGARAADEAFLRDICARGRFTWRFSIQGGTREAHDRTTRRPGAFDRIAAGLGTLKALDQRITANICVNAENVASLPEFPLWLGASGVTSLHADMLRPHSVGDRTEAEVDALLAPYAEVVAALRAMFAGFARHAPHVDVRVGNLPYCLLPERADRISHGTPDTETATADTAGVDLGTTYDKVAYQRDHRSYPAVCADCHLRPRCRGVPDAYLAKYGDAEFRAIPAPDPVPPPRAHHRGTVGLVERIARLGGGETHLPALRDLLGDASELPERGDGGLKFDAYLARGATRRAWGLTVNSRWDARALDRFEAFARRWDAGYAWDRVGPLWDRLGGVLTLGVGFDAPDRPPRLKLYVQEDAWGAGVLDAAEAAALTGRDLPSWVSGRLGVVTLELHAGGATSWKVYVGGATPELAVHSAPEPVQRLARRLARLCPLQPSWTYATIRLGDEPRYALNKIYDHTRALAGPASAPWRDVASLFSGAGRSAELEALLREIRGMPGVRVLPTATAVEDDGGSVDVYCAAWAAPR